MHRSVIMGVVFIRYVLLPISGVLIVRGAHRLGLVSSEPLYQFVLLLQYVVPPAMNLGLFLQTQKSSTKDTSHGLSHNLTILAGTITQLFGSGESECSVILFWSYALASVSLTIWPTFFMWLVA